jgi:hypothetical protein
LRINFWKSFSLSCKKDSIEFLRVLVVEFPLR